MYELDFAICWDFLHLNMLLDVLMFFHKTCLLKNECFKGGTSFVHHHYLYHHRLLLVLNGLWYLDLKCSVMFILFKRMILTHANTTCCPITMILNFYEHVWKPTMWFGLLNKFYKIKNSINLFVDDWSLKSLSIHLICHIPYEFENIWSFG